MDYLYVLQCIRESSPDFINVIFVVISEVLMKLVMVYAAITFWCINKKEGATILLGYTATYQLNQLIKNTACVYRPWIKDGRLHVAKEAVKSATGYSFPSGHTVSAGALYGGIGVYQKKRKWVVAIMSLLILLTAFSRNWLGAHTMPDVLVAVIEAAVMLILVNIARYYLEKNPEKDTWFLIGGIVVAAVILLILQLKKYPMDYDSEGNLICDPYKMLTDCYTACGMLTGSLLGWWLERHFVKFDTEGTKKQLILRGVIGTAAFGLVYVLADLIFDYIEILAPMSRNPGHFGKYGLVFFFIFYIYPVCFKAVHNKISENK